MEQVETFFAMGGYGAFVWAAFGLTALVLIGLLVSTLRGLRANERALEKLKAARPGRGGRARGRETEARP